MSMPDIALRILADQRRDTADGKLVASTAGHTRNALSQYRRIEAVRPVEGSVSGRGGGLRAGMLWKVLRKRLATSRRRQLLSMRYYV